MPKKRTFTIPYMEDEGPPFSPDSGVPMKRDEFDEQMMKDRATRDGDRSFMPAFEEVRQEHNRSTEDTNAAESTKSAEKRGNPIDPL